jgi:membrane associated rhomboid family serine protease
VIPLRDENPSHSVPFVTRGLIAVNVALFVYELSLGPGLREFMMRWGIVPGRVTEALFSGGAGEPLLAPALTFVTSVFLHGGWAHLIGNMWYLWIFGDNVEDRLGPAGFVLFYLAAGVFASLVHTFANPASLLPTVGASGAIAGVLGAYAVAFPRARVITLVPLFPFFQVMALPALLVLGLWFVFQFFTGALALAYSAGGGVAWWAHIGGFAFGALVMLVFGRRRPRASRAWVDA